MSYTPPDFPANYNQNPPPDDGSQVSENVTRWADVKNKLADPLRIFSEDINAAVVDAFDDFSLDDLEINRNVTGTQPRALNAQVLDTHLNLKEFGAVGNASNETGLKLQAAIDYLESTNPGVIFVPRGSYLCNETAVISMSDGRGIRITGENMGGTNFVRTASAAGTILTVTGLRHKIENLSFYHSVFVDAASGSGLLSIQGGVQIKLDNLDINGGVTCLGMQDTATRDCADNTVDRCVLQNSTSQFIAQSISNHGNLTGAHYYRRTLFNQTHPGGANDWNERGTWTPSTSYATGDVVSMTGPNGGDYLVKAVESGTSGSVQPALQFYNTDIIDNTVTWHLAFRTSSAGLNLGTGVTLSIVENCDATGPYSAGYLVDNLLAGDAPRECAFNHCNSDGPRFQALDIAAGTAHSTIGFAAVTGLNSTASGILVRAGVSKTLIMGTRRVSGFDQGINIQSGATDTIVVGNHAFNNNTNFSNGGTNTQQAANIFP